MKDYKPNKMNKFDLDKIYTLDEFHLFTKNEQILLYNQMLKEGKGIKIYIKEYDETEPEIIASNYDGSMQKKYKHLAFVVEIDVINISSQPKGFVNGNICFNKKKKLPKIKNTFINGVVCDKDAVNRITLSFGHTVYWIFKNTILVNKLLNIKTKYIIDSMCNKKFCSIDTKIETAISIVFDNIKKTLPTDIKFDLCDENAEDARSMHSYNLMKYFNVSYCGWKLKKSTEKHISEEREEPDTEITNLLYKKIY